MLFESLSAWKRSSFRRNSLFSFVAALWWSAAGVTAHAQSIVIEDGPGTVPAKVGPGGTANFGTYPLGVSVFTDGGVQFYFTQPIQITSYSYEAGPGGVVELTAQGLVGASCFYNQVLPAGSICGMNTGVKALYPGLRSSALRIGTTVGTFRIPVSFYVTGAQVSFTPGTSVPAVGGGAPLTTAGGAMAVDAQGNLYLTNSSGTVINKVDAVTGAVTIFAGQPNNPNNSGDGGLATAADIQYPVSVAASPAGDIYIVTSQQFADDGIRKVDGGTGIISTVGGILSGRTLGKGGQPVSANPMDGTVVVDESGGIYSSTPLANEIAGPSGSLVGGTCTPAAQYTPTVLAVSAGYLYFYSNAGIFKVSTGTNAACPVVTPVAGTGTSGYGGDGGQALAAQIGTVSGLAVDAAGDVYLADATSGVVRVVSGANGTITTIAGGSSGVAVSVLGGLSSLALDPAGDLYVLGSNGIVQKISVAGNLQFASTTVGTTSADSPKSLTATNTGNTPLASGTAVITAGFAIDAASTCVNTTGAGAGLAVGTSCTLGIDFKPMTAGPITGTFNLQPGSQTVPALPSGVVALSGAAVAATTTTVNISPGAINFGTVTQGNSSGLWTINIANTGSSPLILSGIALSDTNDFLLGGGCGQVAAYSSCNLTLQFKPQSTGTINASLVLTDNASPNTQTIPLTGMSQAAASGYRISPGSINFGQVTVGSTSAAWTVNVTNTGATTVTLNKYQFADAADYVLSLGTCSQPIAAYGACNFTVTFAPQSTSVPTSQLNLGFNGSSGYTDGVTLSGVGVAANPPVVQLSPSTINFTNIYQGNNSGVWTVYVGNTGASPLKIGSIVLSDTKDYILGGNCGATVAAYSSCAETIEFKPQGTGSLPATITFTDNASPATQTVTLMGNSIPRSYAMKVTPSSLTLAAGETGQATFAMTPTPGFVGSVSFTCAGLPANASCSFAPGTLNSDGSGAVLSSQITVQTRAGYDSAMNGRGLNGRGNGVAMASLLGFGTMLLGWPRLRRKSLKGWPMLVLAGAVCAGLAGMSGCGSAVAGLASPGTRAVQVTGTVTARTSATPVAASAGAEAQAATLTLTIAQ